MTYSYSPDKQVTAESFPNGSLLANTSFGAGYDAGNRVTSYTRTGGITPPNQTWNYDDNGNWASTTLAGQTDTRTHNADNELTSGSATYDARGNMTKDPDGNEYYYDLDNRIFKIEMHQGPTVEFLYDATGRRVQSKQGTTKTAYLWWGDQECSEHKHQSGQAVIQNDLWAHPTALNTIIARAVDGSKFKMEWYHKNYLDHVYAVSDDSGDIIEHYRYSAFGIVEFYDPAGTQIASSQINNPVLWNSRRYDEVTKLYYYKYRHYIPKLGRWSSRDPVEERGGVNLYEFVRNDGLNGWDIFGMLKAGDVIPVFRGSVQGLMGEKCGEITVNKYESAPWPSEGSTREIGKGTLLPDGSFLMPEQVVVMARNEPSVFFDITFAPRTPDCCCKDGEYRWIQTVIEDDNPLAGKVAPYLDNGDNKKPYYYDYLELNFQDAPNILVGDFKRRGKRNVKTKFKLDLVCSTQKDEILHSIEWGMIFKLKEGVEIPTKHNEVDVELINHPQATK